MWIVGGPVVDLCAENHFTHILFMFQLTHLKCPSLVSDGRFAFNAAALDMDEIQELVDYVVSKGLRPIPGITLLTQQQDPNGQVDGGLAASFPVSHPFMLNKSTYDPNNAELMALIDDCIEELIPLFVVNGENPLFFKE